MVFAPPNPLGVARYKRYNNLLVLRIYKGLDATASSSISPDLLFRFNVFVFQKTASVGFRPHSTVTGRGARNPAP